MYSLPLLYGGECVAALREAFYVRLSMGRTFYILGEFYDKENIPNFN